MKISAVPFKRLIGSGFLGLTICLLSLPTQSLTVKEVPNPRHISGNWVTDSAEILSPGTEAQLNNTSNARLREILSSVLPKALELLRSGEKLVEISGD